MSVVQSGLWLLLIGFSSYFGLSWRSLAYGIAFGLGIFASVDLATEAMRVWTGPVAGYAFDFVSMATYHCCVVIWLVYLLAPEMARRTVKGIAGTITWSSGTPNCNVCYCNDSFLLL